MATSKERAQELARALIMHRAKLAIIDANDTLNEIPENDEMDDDEWFALMAEVDRLAAVAELVIMFPEES